MKQLLLIPLLVFIPLMVIAQKSLSYLRKDTKVEKLLVLPPVTQIYVMGETSDECFDSTLTACTNRHIVDILKSSFPDSVQISFFNGDSISITNVFSFIDGLNNEILYEKQLKKYKVPDAIVSLFNSLNINYAFVTYYTGIKRVSDYLLSKTNSRQRKDLLVDIGKQSELPVTFINCFVIDLNEKNILFFERNLWTDKDPTDIKVINLMLRSTIKHYFIQ